MTVILWNCIPRLTELPNDLLFINFSTWLFYEVLHNSYFTLALCISIIYVMEFDPVVIVLQKRQFLELTTCLINNVN